MNYTTDDLAHICNDLASSGADPALEFVAQRLWELDAEVKKLEAQAEIIHD